MNERIYDVLIVGGGPTGLVLANLLGLSGATVCLMEKHQEAYPYPRATHLDAETMRNLQLTGLMEELMAYTSPFEAIDVIDSQGKVLFKEDEQQMGNNHSYQGSRFFDQVGFERILRKGLGRFPHIQACAGAEVKAIKQTDMYVTAVVADAHTGKTSMVKGQWLVGADGAKSMVRANMNVGVDSLVKPRSWVIVDAVLKDPSDAALLPQNVRYIFDERRLTLYAHGYGLNRRWEFQLGHQEERPSEEEAAEWVAAYIPKDKIDVMRVAFYAHQAWLAQQWRCGRILLAGDAAHVMPPSAGQGLCSGIRDAVNLAWKLAAVAHGEMATHILDTYQQERYPHLKATLKRTLAMSDKAQGDDFLQRRWRSLQLMAITLVRPLKNHIQKIYRQEIPLAAGFIEAECPLAGTHLPQFGISDDALGYGFVLIAAPNLLDDGQVLKAKLLGIKAIHTDRDLWKTPFLRWMKAQRIDWVIARPDKIIFSAGKAQHYSEAIAMLGKYMPETQLLKVS